MIQKSFTFEKSPQGILRHLNGYIASFTTHIKTEIELVVRQVIPGGQHKLAWRKNPMKSLTPKNGNNWLTKLT